LLLQFHNWYLDLSGLGFVLRRALRVVIYSHSFVV
jgi:hypothetical protein